MEVEAEVSVHVLGQAMGGPRKSGEAGDMGQASPGRVRLAQTGLSHVFSTFETLCPSVWILIPEGLIP